MILRKTSLSVLALAGLAGCTVPTDAPATDVRWVVPAKTTQISVASFLPTGVAIVADSSAFTVSVLPGVVSRQLSQDCPACSAANGLNAPKPAFTGVASTSSSLPPEIASATLAAGGTLLVVVQNGYNFDPLRPNPTTNGATGFAVILVSNGGTVIGKDSVNGATTALTAGSSLTRSIPLSGTINGSSPITVSVTLNSPAGENVTIDASRSITFTVTPQNIRVPTASITVANKSVNSSSQQDLTGVDKTISDHVLSGSLLLTIANPFTATGNLSVTLTPQGGAPISRNIALAVGTSNVSVAYTGAEIQKILGHNITIAYTGTVNSTGGAVAVSPKQAVVVQSRLDLSLELGTIKP